MLAQSRNSSDLAKSKRDKQHLFGGEELPVPRVPCRPQQERALCQESSSRQGHAWGQGGMGDLRSSRLKCHRQPQQQSSWEDTETENGFPFRQGNRRAKSLKL